MLSSTLWRAFTTPVTYALIFILLATAIMQIRYVNKALQRSDSTVVIPIQFVMFTMCVIIGSAVLYRDFERTTPRQAVKFIGGCLLTFFGVFLVTSGRTSSDDDGDSYLHVDDSEEAIGLLDQDHAQGSRSPETPRDTVRSRGSSRSSRTSRASFTGGFTKPLGLHSSGVPSLRAPPHEAAKLSRSSDLVEGPNPWLEPDEDNATAEDIIVSPTTRPSIMRQDTAVSAPLLVEPSTPPAAGATFYDASEPQLTPGRSSTVRPQRRLTGPLISPSPLSSTVSAVVTDTLRRHGDRSLMHRSSLGRIRSSIRASLFMEDEDGSQGEGESRAPLLGELIDVEGAGQRGEEGDTKGRARSLSDTLGELFRSKGKGGNSGDVESGGDVEG